MEPNDAANDEPTLMWASQFLASFVEGRISGSEFCAQSSRLGLWAQRLPDEDPGPNLLWHFVMWMGSICWDMEEDLTLSEAREAGREMMRLLDEGQESWARTVQQRDETGWP
jgi:hypothetical protein